MDIQPSGTLNYSNVNNASIKLEISEDMIRSIVTKGGKVDMLLSERTDGYLFIYILNNKQT